MKKFKQVAAFTMAVSLAAGSSFAVLAEDGSISGDGQVEGVLPKEIYSVVLPTVAEGDTTFDFVLDPEGLIAATGGAAHGGDASKYDQASNIFFANVDAATSDVTYSNKSDALVVTNKSNIPVDITLSATIENSSGITLKTADDYTDDTEASLYLALTDGTNTEAITTEGVSLTAEVGKAPEDAYEIKWEADKGYYYELTADAQDPAYTGFEAYSFNLTGSCNENGDWTNVKDATPKVSVVWSVEGQFADRAPSITGDTYTATDGQDLVVNLSMGGGDLKATGITSVKYTTASGKSATVPAANYEVTSTAVTIKADYLTQFKSGVKFAFTFNDEAKTVGTITVQK